MEADVIAVLKRRAADIGRVAGRTLHSRWYYFWDDNELDIDIVEPGTIRFYRGKPNTNKDHDIDLRPFIEFSDVSATEITRTVVGDAKSLGSKIVDVQSTTVDNHSDTLINRNYNVEVSEERSTLTDVGAELSVQIIQKISYGGAISPLSGETDVAVSATAKYDKQVGSTERESKVTSTGIIVEPWSEATVTTERKIGEFKQKVTYYCDLDHAVKIVSLPKIKHISDIFHHNREEVHLEDYSGNNEDLALEWDTFDDIKDVFLGIAPDSIRLGEYYRKEFNAVKHFDTQAKRDEYHNWIKDLQKKSNIKFDVDIEFNKSTLGKVVVKSKALDQKKKNDALLALGYTKLVTS